MPEKHHLPPHYGQSGSFHRPDYVNQPLYVICPLFNPIRWKSRWKLYKEFERYVVFNKQAHLVTIECSYGERERVTEPIGENHTVIHVRTQHELWLKENLINIAVSRLPHDWKYVCWVDADMTFIRPDWVGETLQQLQHYKVVQMWSQYQDVTPSFELVGTMRSFMDCYLHGGDGKIGGNPSKCHQYPYVDGKKRVGYPGAPGLAWAMRRDAWDALGGLIDISILGACDWYMAHALVGNLKLVLSSKYHKRYREQLFEWQNRANHHIRKNVGVVNGIAIHYWHGKKINRKYGSREQILIGNQYNPDTDLKRDWQGLHQLTDQFEERSINLKRDIMEYFRQRNEDSLAD